MAATNLFQELKDALQTFKDFLDQNVPVIKPAIQQLASMIPQITELLDKLVSLMNDLKTEIQNLDVSNIPGLSQVSEFTQGVRSLLTTAKNLLPDQGPTIDDVLGVVEVVSSLPSLDQVKQEILTLIDAIVVHLNSLKPA